MCLRLERKLIYQIMLAYFAWRVFLGGLLGTIGPAEIYATSSFAAMEADDIADAEPAHSEGLHRKKRELNSDEIDEALNIHNLLREQEVTDSQAASIKRMVRCTI